MRERRLRVAWVVILVADLGVLAYGLLAVFSPDQLTAGYESATGRAWSELVASIPQTADFILLLFRLLGGFNVAVAALALPITATAYRQGERWAWWTLLIGNTLAFGAPISYDQIVGEVGVFEILEIVALAAIYLALGLTAPERRTPGKR